MATRPLAKYVVPLLLGQLRSVDDGRLELDVGDCETRMEDARDEDNPATDTIEEASVDDIVST